MAHARLEAAKPRGQEAGVRRVAASLGAGLQSGKMSKSRGGCTTACVRPQGQALDRRQWEFPVHCTTLNKLQQPASGAFHV